MRLHSRTVVPREGEIVFDAHTQDFGSFADQSLPLGEQALKTFTASLAQ